MKYHVKSNPYFEAKIYIGSRQQYNGPAFSFDDVRAAVAEYQESRGLEWANPVRITATHYLFQDYLEPGWEIAIIDYRSQKSREIWV